MKRCYYDILEVDRKATPAEIKAVLNYLFRIIVNWLLSIIQTKIQMRMQNRNLYRLTKHIMCFMMLTKELGMIIIEKRYFSIRINLANKI